MTARFARLEQWRGRRLAVAEHIRSVSPLSAVVVVDPLSSFTGATAAEVDSMVVRLIDYLKGRDITALMTHLIPGSGTAREVEVGVSSLIDTWILLRNAPPGEQGGRHLSILKSRGMSHSSERRSFKLTDRGPVRL